MSCIDGHGPLQGVLLSTTRDAREGERPQPPHDPVGWVDEQLGGF